MNWLNFTQIIKFELLLIMVHKNFVNICLCTSQHWILINCFIDCTKFCIHLKKETLFALWSRKFFNLAVTCYLYLIVLLFTQNTKTPHIYWYKPYEKKQNRQQEHFLHLLVLFKPSCIHLFEEKFISSNSKFVPIYDQRVKPYH